MSSPGISEASTRAGPPPPPPPPPVPGQVPALRLSTAAELGGARKGPQGPQEAYEPPAAIQNAMMTKDKKPFTYTPGMGGKLDLSQIRSPRMARRVAKNANDEGVEGPPKSALVQEPRNPASNIYSHPQVAVAVFPQQPVGNLRSTLPRSPAERVDAPPKPMVKIETKIVPVVNSPETPSTPTSPTSPTQITLAKAPTPWMQKQVKQQEELPEWAKRPSPRSQELDSQPRVVQIDRAPPPTRIEDRPSVFSAMNEPGHHQLMNTAPHHQSRWGNPVGMSCAPPSPQQQGAAYIVPVQISPQHQYQTASNKITPVDNQNYKNSSRACANQSQQAEPGPVQSKSFRVLQKITDTDPDQIDTEQVRKLQLTEDDRCLMNKFKEQVDGDTYLHQEEDPRYRGATIPSRAFRYLQNITESGEFPSTNNTSRPVNSVVRNQNRNSKTFEEPTVYLPPSEQQAPEPKKYMGAAIPSRSFRILQAMTAPESIATATGTATAAAASASTEAAISGNADTANNNLESKNSAIYSGPAIAASTEPPAVRIPSESDSFEDKSESSCSSKTNDEADSSQSCDSSCDSDSYLAYSIGLNPSKKPLFHEEFEANTEADDNDSTDCDQQDIDEGDDGDYNDDSNDDDNSTEEEEEEEDEEEEEEEGEGDGEEEKIEKDNSRDEGEENKTTNAMTLALKKTSQMKENEAEVQVEEDENEEEEEENKDKEEEEEANSATISVRLPLRLKSKDDMIIETCVDFTLKRPQENPRFVVTNMENVKEENEAEAITKEESESPSTTITNLLSVPQENSSREEVTDDEDSGVTSDMSRIISEVDTDSECCLGKPRLQNKKYQRTQTHSRLFRLLSLEQLKLPTHQDNSSNSSGLTSPDCSLMQELGQQLPTRPKSLDCEALFKRYREKQQDDSYYQTWKNGQQEQSQWKSEQRQSMNPRFKVLCPRVKSARNLSQTRKSLHHGLTESTVNSVSSNTVPPSPQTLLI